MHLNRWNDGLETGRHSIDSEHQHTLAMVAGLLDPVSEREAVTRDLGMLRHLQAHLATHFAQEEQVMVEHAYPDLALHRAAHGLLSDYVARVVKEMSAPQLDRDLVSVSNRLLGSWLVRHIMTADQALAEFLRTRPR